MITAYNYHIMNSLHLLIGGGNFVTLPSLGLDIQRSSVCLVRIGDRFSCVSESLSSLILNNHGTEND